MKLATIADTTPLADGRTELAWSVEGEPTIARDKVVSILQRRYQSRIEELKQCLARGGGTP